MLSAVHPIYEFLYCYLRDTFSREPVADANVLFPSARTTLSAETHPFKSCSRAYASLDVRNVDHRVLPAGYLEWGSISDVERSQSPQGWSYQMRFKFVIRTWQGQGRTSAGVFRSSEQESMGIGDIVVRVMQSLWDQLHSQALNLDAVRSILGNSVYTSAEPVFTGEVAGYLPISSSDWWVRNWTFNVDDEAREGADPEVVRLAPDNPLVRETVVNFKFDILERVAV